MFAFLHEYWAIINAILAYEVEILWNFRETTPSGVKFVYIHDPGIKHLLLKLSVEEQLFVILKHQNEL